MASIGVFLVAPPLVSWGLERLVQSAMPRLELIGSAPSLEEAGPRIEAMSDGVVLLDFDDGQPMDALVQLQQRLRAKLLLITQSCDAAVLDDAVMRGGVRGVVRKHDPVAMLLKAIEKVHEGELWIDRGATGRIFMQMARRKATEARDPEQSRISTLTVRERQAIAALASAAGAPAKVIAGRLCISEHTLRNHLTSIYSKLGLANRLDLYAYATRHGLNK
ncbi:response regulator transcription factor [Ramlibacter sp.]|uniref:response regulator transcription factor n=1 Tax=Ramlibacter sp. TaxID=1917967 RepID=UPI001830EFCE|nr:response regulator transcription factor [Ramlibacter sp.]MBA2672159.1 response regulator transcription factor [Ramlibacter sp.]